MSMTLRRRSHPVFGMLNWLEGSRTSPPGPAPELRVEDFVRDGSYVLRAEIPGVDPETDIDVRVTGDLLIVAGSRQEEERSKDRRELRYGAFYRAVSLPEGADADAATASYDDGVLEVAIPVNDKVARTRRVPVDRTED